jgi:hypothetical protein
LKRFHPGIGHCISGRETFSLPSQTSPKFELALKS